MSKFDRTCIVADLENKLAAVDSTTNTFEAYALSASVKALTNDRQVTVSCACDLPDLCIDRIADGQPIYVEEYQVPVISTNGCWIGIDGRLARQDVTPGQVWLWGNNTSGQLGNNCCQSTSSCPVREFCNDSSWYEIVDATDGISFFSIKTDGTLWGWGYNNCGQLGTNNTINYSTPQQEVCGGTTWCMVSGGSLHTSSIKTDGTLWSWGSNTAGQLGTCNTICHSTPTQEACGGTNWCMVSDGCLHTSAIKTDGTLWSMGINGGRLGTNSTVSHSTPTQEACGGTNWCMVSGGCTHTSAIKTDGTLWSWGSNVCGALGTNNLINYSTPQQEICGGTNWCMVSSGGSFSMAIKTNGTLWGWGQNNLFGFAARGNLGTNNSINYSTPQQEVCGGTNWCMVNAGLGSTMAIKTDGTLWGMGSNSCSTISAGNPFANYSSPTQEVCGFTDWNSVSLGSTNGIGLRIP
jgi:alpha-tubulin suppressor-like RCC1 family protein